MPAKFHLHHAKRYWSDAKSQGDRLAHVVVMARQTAIRRAEEQDRIRRENGQAVPGRLVTPPHRRPSSAAAAPLSALQDQGDSRSRHSISPAPDIAVNAAPVSPRRQASPKRQNSINGDKLDSGLWNTMMEIGCLYKYPLHVTPLLYIILTELTQTAEGTLKRIEEAQEDLRRFNPLFDQLQHQRPPPEHFQAWPYYCPRVLPQQSVIKHFNPYRFHSTIAHHYHPYSIMPPCKSLGREPMNYLPLHEANGPSLLVPSERIELCYDSDDRKRGSPSSFCSDKSSLSGSLET